MTQRCRRDSCDDRSSLSVRSEWLTSTQKENTYVSRTPKRRIHEPQCNANGEEP